MQQVGVLKYSKVLLFMSSIFFTCQEVRWRVMFIFRLPLNLVELRRVCVYVCVCMYVYVGVDVDVYVCVCWFVCMCMYVCVCWCWCGCVYAS